MASSGLRPHPILCAQMRVLRLRLAGRRRSPCRSIPGSARARNRNRAGRAAGSRYHLRRRGDTHAAGCPAIVATLLDHQGMAAPRAPWRVDGRGESWHARRRQSRSAGRREAGVDRISLSGINRFSRRALARGARAATRTTPRSRPLWKSFDRRFARWSLDLMLWRAPARPKRHWRDDLDIGLSFSPSHLSCYGLVFEKGTALWNQKQSGFLVQPGRRGARAADVRTHHRAACRGWSSDVRDLHFARPGHESRHNLVYWANDAYFGFGVGAASYLRGIRKTNTRDLPAYLRRIEAGESATGPHEQLSPEDRGRVRRAMLMLRRTRGGHRARGFPAKNRFRPPRPPWPADVIERFKAAEGYLEDDGRRVRLEPGGGVPCRQRALRAWSELVAYRSRNPSRRDPDIMTRSGAAELIRSGCHLDGGCMEKATRIGGRVLVRFQEPFGVRPGDDLHDLLRHEVEHLIDGRRADLGRKGCSDILRVVRVVTDRPLSAVRAVRRPFRAAGRASPLVSIGGAAAAVPIPRLPRSVDSSSGPVC